MNSKKTSPPLMANHPMQKNDDSPSTRANMLKHSAGTSGTSA
jgi:hypothetical protein